jgi:hypothetical protein
MFGSGTDHFGSPEQRTLLNFRVRDLDAMLSQPRDAGADVAPETQDMAGVGRFGWVTDPEGNQIELWQPARRVITTAGRSGGPPGRPNRTVLALSLRSCSWPLLQLLTALGMAAVLSARSGTTSSFGVGAPRTPPASPQCVVALTLALSAGFCQALDLSSLPSNCSSEGRAGQPPPELTDDRPVMLIGSSRVRHRPRPGWRPRGRGPVSLVRRCGFISRTR